MLKILLTENGWLNLALVAQIFTGSVFLAVLMYTFSKKNKKKFADESAIPFYEESKQ